ncbi:gastrula zinc finger protein XlCGF71.1-like [Rhopalosiphum padi]|uniref:gastrula zinc finger protein XlCGF71.1-like n=1 Tax=Rhopalosiphum padi TaxID=40932 RepID=UPI00298D7452|nr:gastrula zinc finger protein XlCGF71.1-like [Rhopalosiphum padi]XP_060853747.1 gastrula zinc finger protein XlCGF71.1-like [Rhopalosiphum padi]
MATSIEDAVSVSKIIYQTRSRKNEKKPEDSNDNKEDTSLLKKMVKQKIKIETMDHTEIMSSKKSKKPNQPTTKIEDPKMCFTCDVCNASFTQKHHIVRHCRIHTSEKPFSCDVCCKTFRDQSNLQNHLNTHTEEKRFQCFNCGKKFRKNYNLLVHYRTHSREKPYKCNECILSYMTNGNLTRHISIKHP